MIKFDIIERVTYEPDTIEEAAKMIGADKGAVIETDAWHGERTLIAYFYAVDNEDDDYVKYAFSFAREADLQQGTEGDIKNNLIGSAAQTFVTSFSDNKSGIGEQPNTFSDKIIKTCKDKSPESNIIQEYMRIRKEACYDDDIPF